MQRSSGGKVSRFIEGFLTLGGSHLGQPFKLLEWQKASLQDIYLLDDQGKRIRRTYVLGLPRKQGKSQLGAALAIYHLVIDDADAGPQVISAAGDRKQARLVFDEARRMVMSSPELSAICTVNRDVITCSRNGGTYRAVSADAGLQQGLNPSFVVFDELHVFKTPELFQALQLGSAARNQPLTLVISTAGYDLESPLGKLYTYGLRVDHRLNGKFRKGEDHDPTFGMDWWGPEPGETYDPSDPAVWQRFNPSWDLLRESEFSSNFRLMHESAFTRYHLNGWTSSEASFLPHGAWNRCRTSSFIPEKTEVVLGFDGAWKGDSTGLVAVSLEDFHIQVLGLWEAPPNDPTWRTPASEVQTAIREACETYAVREVAADPWRFEQALLELMDDGIPIVEFPTNSLARMVPATQVFYDAVMDRTLTHDGNPALARHMANAVLKEDAKGGRITKETKSSHRHIDLAVAAIIGHQRARVWREQEPVREPQILVL